MIKQKTEPLSHGSVFCFIGVLIDCHAYYKSRLPELAEKIAERGRTFISTIWMRKTCVHNTQ